MDVDIKRKRQFLFDRLCGQKVGVVDWFDEQPRFFAQLPAQSIVRRFPWPNVSARRKPLPKLGMTTKKDLTSI